MKARWAIAGGIALGLALAWWASREPPEAARAREARAAQAAAADAADARPVLYRWRDAQGNLHVTQTPPKGRKYERVDMQPREAIEVHGDRD